MNAFDKREIYRCSSERYSTKFIQMNVFKVQLHA